MMFVFQLHTQLLRSHFCLLWCLATLDTEWLWQYLLLGWFFVRSLLQPKSLTVRYLFWFLLDSHSICKNFVIILFVLSQRFCWQTVFFLFARSGTSSLGAVTSFCWWVCTPCTRALCTMMCFQSHSTYLGRTGLSITTCQQLHQTRICSWILAPQTTTATPILLAWIQYGRWCFSFLWNIFLL